MRGNTRESAATRAFGFLDTAGSVLVLQLLFLVTSALVITAVPAAVALQRALPAAFDGTQAHPVRSWVSQLRMAFSQSWVLGLGLPFLVLAALGSLLAWMQIGGSWASAAIGLLAALACLALVTWLGMLAAAASAPDTHRWVDWLRAAPSLVLARPVWSIAAAVVLVTWLALSYRLPTLLLITSGLVPALLVQWAFLRDKRGAHDRAE